MDETKQSARQLIHSLEGYQLNEVAMLLAAIKLDNNIDEVGDIIAFELQAAGRNAEAAEFVQVYANMMED